MIIETKPPVPLGGDLRIETVPVAALRPYPRNARKHPRAQLRRLADSVREFGFIVPALITAEGEIVCGHGRVEAAKLVGLTEIPVVRVDHLTEEQVKAFRIADNRLAELATWDRDTLAIEFGDLELVFDDLAVTGFEMAEIEILLDGEQADGAEDEADNLPEVDDTPPVSVPGDIWLLGGHWLMCGDATNPEHFRLLMGNHAAQTVFVDPPYNVPIDGHVCGLGTIKHEAFAMAAGEMSEAEFTAFLTTVFQNLADFSADGSIHFVCMDWRHLWEALGAGRAVYDKFKNLCVWNKTNGGMGTLYRSKHELVLVFKNGTAPHVNNVQLGKHGRYRTNVWDYAGINSFEADRMEHLAMHPTVKPVKLVADALRDCSHRGDTVLDCFAGSGSTLIAAEQTGRIARAMELEPKYVDVTIERYRRLTGEDAVNAETLERFEDRQAQMTKEA